MTPPARDRRRGAGETFEALNGTSDYKPAAALLSLPGTPRRESKCGDAAKTCATAFPPGPRAHPTPTACPLQRASPLQCFPRSPPHRLAPRSLPPPVFAPAAHFCYPLVPKALPTPEEFAPCRVVSSAAAPPLPPSPCPTPSR